MAVTVFVPVGAEMLLRLCMATGNPGWQRERRLNWSRIIWVS